jgi:ADP-heptose:LPS heptosyltransferase
MGRIRDNLVSALRFLRASLCWLLDSGVIVSSRYRPHAGDTLVVRLDGIGDFILWLGYAQQLRGAVPGTRMILVANRLWADWARQLGIFDEVWSLDRKRFLNRPGYRLSFQRKVRRAGFTRAINPVHSREAWLGDSIVRVCGAAVRQGFIGNLANASVLGHRLSSRWYSELFASDPRPLMELRRNAEFLQKLTNTPVLATAADLKPILAALPAYKGLQADYILVPGASWAGKRWPASSFAELANRIHARTGWHGAVCGSADESAVAEQVISKCQAPLTNLCGRLSLMEMAQVASTSRLQVTNDTSLVHLAAAVGIPCVCILGGGHFGRFLPYDVDDCDRRIYPKAVFQRMDCFDCNWHCRFPRANHEPVLCIGSVTVENAWLEVAGILDAHEKADIRRPV